MTDTESLIDSLLTGNISIQSQRDSSLLDKRLGRVYKIVCSCGCNKLYVGSTFSSLSKRMAHHQVDSKKKRHSNRKLYAHMNSLGNWQMFNIIELESLHVDNKDQLRTLEDKYICSLNTKIPAGYNELYAKGTRQRRDRQNEKRKKTSVEVKAKINQYYTEGKESRQTDRSKAHSKFYRQTHKEEIKQKQQRHAQKNKDKFTCEYCDTYSTSRKTDYERHTQSKRHQSMKNDYEFTLMAFTELPHS